MYLLGQISSDLAFYFDRFRWMEHCCRRMAELTLPVREGPAYLYITKETDRKVTP